MKNTGLIPLQERRFIDDLPEDDGSPPSDPKNRDHIEFANFHERSLSRAIEVADAKAQWHGLVLSGLSVAFFTREGFLTALSVVSHEAHPLLSGMAWASTLLIILSFISLFQVVRARIHKPVSGYIFWKSIDKNYSEDTFFQEIKSASPERLLEDRIRNNFRLAKICTRKFAAYGFALRITALWLLVSVAYLITAAVMSGTNATG